MRSGMRAIVTLLLFGTALLGCTCQRPEKLRLGINPWPGYELLWLAHDLNIYKKHNLDVDIYEYTSLVDAQTAMSRGKIDVLCSTLIELFLVDLPAGARPTPVLVSDYSNGADVILAKRQIIPQIADIKGRRVGIEAGSLGEYVLARALKLNGIQEKDVTLIKIDQTKMGDSLEKNSIDAAVTYPPISVALRRNPDVHELFSSKDIPGEVIDVISVTPQVLERDPHFREKLTGVWRDALAHMRADPAGTITRMAAREHITDAEFVDALAGMQLLDADQQGEYFGPRGKLVEIIANVRDVLVESKMITPDSPTPRVPDR